MRYLTLILVVTLLWSCKVQEGLGDADCKQFLGLYDTCTVMKAKWHHGTTTLVCFHDSAAVVIWGKKCDFEKDELLYAKGEWWGSIRKWKYFLVNEQENIRYSLK